MGDYYNKTRGPIAVTLQRGGSMSIGPKTWCYIPPEDEGTPSLAVSVRKGFLHRALVAITDTTPVVAAPVVSETIVPVVADTATTSVADSSVVASPADPVSDPASTSSVIEPKPSRRNK